LYGQATEESWRDVTGTALALFPGKQDKSGKTLGACDAGLPLACAFRFEEKYTMTKTLWTGWGATLLAVMLLTGCTEESTPGGPGATTTTPATSDMADDDSILDNDPEPGEPINSDATFELQYPTGATNIEQGQAETVTISVDRGDEFTGEVNVTLTAPAGITVNPEQFTFAAGEDEKELQVTVAPTAILGEQIIQVEGVSAGGPPAKGELKIEVTEGNAGDAPADTGGAFNPNPANPVPANPANPEGGAPPADNP
jgi:hypothetical protein